MKELSRNIFDYLKENNNKDLTAQDIADVLGIAEKKKIDSAFTRSIQRADLGYRKPGEIELPDGTHKAVKFLHLNDAGMAFDPDEVDENEEN